MNAPSNAQQQPEEMISDQNADSPSGSRRLGLGCGLLLLIIIATLAFIRSEANKALKARIEKVKADLQAAETLIPVSRKYPFDAQLEDEASRYYRSLDWLCSEASSPLRLTSNDLPKLERGLWTGKDKDLQTHGRVLGSFLDQGTKSTKLRQDELDTARAFVNEHGETVLNLLWSGVLSDHIRWPGDLKQGVTMETSNLLTQRSAANLALFMASQRTPTQAIELALMINAFGRDHAHHPTLLGAMIGAAIEHLALKSLERRMISEGLEPSDRDLERIISGLGAMPNLPSHAMKFEALGFDSTLANLLTNNDPKASMELLGDGLMFALPELILWQWGSLDRYRTKLESTWTLPIQEAIALEKVVSKELEENRSAALARLILPNLLQARINLLECQAKTDLTRLAAAAQLYRRKNGKWPEKPADLSDQFHGKIPTDPLSEGADYSFDISDDNWTASASTINRAINITLPPQRKAKAGD